MGPVTQDTNPKRRKWGWIFVALFFVQGAIFLGAYASAFRRATQLDGLAHVHDRPSLQSAALQAHREVSLIRYLAGFGSVICLVGAALGFRCYK